MGVPPCGSGKVKNVRPPFEQGRSKATPVEDQLNGFLLWDLVGGPVATAPPSRFRLVKGDSDRTS